MMDKPRGWPLPLYPHHQRGCCQFRTQMIAHCPADDLAAEEVHDRGEIQP
jgi:hypothetical protein